MNPDRLAQAAHSIRELLEKAPADVDVPAGKGSTTLKSQTNNLSTAWARAVSNSSCYDGGSWTGEIDGPLRKFLTKTKRFFDWVADERPPRER